VSRSSYTDAAVTPHDLLQFLQSHRLAIQASVSSSYSPQAAIVGIAVSDRFEIVFDTLAVTRKAVNLRANPKAALVVGGWAAGDERTAQIEGIADEPSGEELDRLKRVYYAVYPDGPARLSWPGLIYLRVRPNWIRFSDYNQSPPLIVEFTGADLALRG
jgi:Pyridoxamine 5'-phosphate oxidase